MTSATHVMRRKARIALAVAGVSTALLLTGCSSDSRDDAASTPRTSAAAATATTDTGGDSGTPDAKPGKAEGSWLATTGGKAVALVITGKQAALFAMGGAVCSGTAGEESGMQMIHLKCTDGSKDRTIGMIDSVDSTSMKVTWEGGVGAETYTKSEGGRLPSGLPTASLGS